MRKMIVLVGNYGSCKTEIAINLAVRGAEQGLRTLVIDLDKVNDYFRMSDKVSLLAGKKIDLVSPAFAGKGVTPSSMSAAVASAFTDRWDLVIFDVGGDAAGALSLGRYRQDFAAWEGELTVCDVVNVFRPMSETAEKILKLKEQLEDFARLPVTALVNNSNLLNYASAEDLRRGYEVIRRASEISGLPVVLTTGRKEFLEEFLSERRDPRYIGEPLPLETYMHRSWEAFTKEGF